MFPLILIAAAAIFFAAKKDEKPASPRSPGDSRPGAGDRRTPQTGAPPRAPAPVVAPPSVAGCELDVGLPPEVFNTVSGLMQQATSSVLPAPERLALATALDLAATPIEMSGYPKAAKCLRDQAQRLRNQGQVALVAEGPPMLLDSSPVTVKEPAPKVYLIND